ncbi:hypothetical protein RRG08_017880 [Elysia crispata]|uniref:Structural maintenance of chromosomes flexible hinge domain-containing protein 1 n=1 Tax=Elysia crispata TaxID=231223 RepID=A0AAE0XPM5_9GAST|nr:hypothetical protein RRG08_017880 [Elysia crispata]
MEAPMGKSGMKSVIYIFDRRTSEAPEIELEINVKSSYQEFRKKLKKVLDIKDDNFVISTTSREKLDGEESWGYVEKGDTFYILNNIDQDLCAPAQERVDYLPHYDTIVKGGMYEYYASEGQNPLPYAFAELIDNALAATALNCGPRKIELRLYVDEASINKNCIVVMDNGKGMTSRQLNNWAIYRLSKFTRRQRRGFEAKGDIDAASSHSPLKNPNESIDLADTVVPRFMNSDISYFGVGGKQAVFFIGNSTRMISKPKDSKDVHELSISKEEFERKERMHQSIYTGYIRNRQPGDASHLSPDDDHVARLINEEADRDNFTAVVIQGINVQHITFLKYNFHMWTRQLAHIYHFYLHGPNGNIQSSQSEHDINEAFKNIDIQVNMYIRGGSMKAVNLRNIDDDMQTQYARTAASTFDFKAYIDGSTAIEGIVRYHPFKFDRETYPLDVYGVRVDPVPEDDHGYAINDRPARGRRPIFETYWNGRLIPYTLIEEFEWCSLPKRQKNIPTESYNRISGVIWTNDSFQVSTNKLTFLDLELKLRDKNTNFVRILQGHEKRTNIDKEFQNWLRECNEEHDKQILFTGNQGIVSRLDQPKLKQTPWTKFSMVEWDSKIFKAGHMVRILRTTPVLCGTIQAFYLYGEHEADVYATGGDIELLQEPQSLYSERKFVSLNKLDRGASIQQIGKYIEEEEAKLPDHLLITWPNGLEVLPNEKRSAGKIIGDLKVEICNRKGEKISKIPFSTAGSKKLMMELKVIWHSPSGDQVIVSLLSQHGKTWPYWFRKMDCTKNLGAYTIQLNAVLNESGNTNFAGKELPSHKIKFTVNEAEAVRFTVGVLEGPCKVGVPFNVPLEFQDRFNNATRPPTKMIPILVADGLELSYANIHVKGHSCFIKGVVALGTVNTSAGKTFSLKVSLPDLDQTQTLKIRLMPGPAAKLNVQPETEMRLENGGCPNFKVEVHDAAGNLTSGAKQTVLARLVGASSLPSFNVDCSATGSAVLSGKPILLKHISGEKKILAIFDIQGVRNLKAVERTIYITPSKSPSTIKVFYQGDGKVKEITSAQTLLQEAGLTIDNLSFEIFNEAGQPVQMDEKLVNKVKVNWAPKVTQEMAEKKLLPPIKVLHSVLEPRYCQVSVMDGDGLELQFSVLATPGPATQMMCKLSGDATCTVGLPHPSRIIISCKDKFGNEAQISNTKGMKISGTSLRNGASISLLSNNSAEVKNIIFDEVGQKEVQISLHDMVSSVKCQVLAGPPTTLKIDGLDVEEPLIVHSDQPVTKPFRVLLFDSSGNQCHVKNIATFISRDNKLKIMPSSNSVLTDENGVADFDILTFNGPL